MKHEDARISRPRFLLFAQRLALVSGCCAFPLAACGGGTAEGPGATSPTAASASSAGTATVATNAPISPTSDTPSDGPCRCSWDSNASAAPRVCKKGEENYEGTKCSPGHPTQEGGYHPPMKGPYPPPDLPSLC
jgi:hypothetical protein